MAKWQTPKSNTQSLKLSESQTAKSHLNLHLHLHLPFAICHLPFAICILHFAILPFACVCVYRYLRSLAEGVEEADGWEQREDDRQGGRVGGVV